MKVKEDTISSRKILIPLTDCDLEAELAMPPAAKGLVILVKGQQRGHNAARCKYLSDSFVSSSIATLRVSLLTEEENVDEMKSREDGDGSYNIELLGERLINLIEWLVTEEETMGLRIGIFASDVSAAAAIVAGVRRPKWLSAIVTSAGKLDLAVKYLAELEVPIRLIVGSRDGELIRINQKVLSILNFEKHLDLIPGSIQQEDIGTLEAIADYGEEWFLKHLS